MTVPNRHSQGITLLLVCGLAACSLDHSAKIGCQSDDHCRDGRLCNVDTCMEVSEAGRFICDAKQNCPGAQTCVEGYCLTPATGCDQCGTDFICSDDQCVPDSHTVLLIHSTPDESESFTDSTGRHTVLAQHDAKHALDDQSLSGSSIVFDGTDDYLLVEGNAQDWFFDDSPFTVELWLFVKDLERTQTLLAQWKDPGTHWEIMVDPPQIKFIASNNDHLKQIAFALPSDGTWELKWYHLTIIRDENLKFSVYRSGVLLGSYQDPDDDPIREMKGTRLSIGSRGVEGPAVNRQPLNGALDEIRISKGIARRVAVPNKLYGEWIRE